jgi:hypothetical protein
MVGIGMRKNLASSSFALETSAAIVYEFQRILHSQPDFVIGINAVEDSGNGFVTLSIIVPSSISHIFIKVVHAFCKHFNFI